MGLSNFSDSEGNYRDPDPKRQRLEEKDTEISSKNEDEDQIRDSEDEAKLVLEDEKFCAASGKEKKQVRCLFSSDSETEEKDDYKIKIDREAALLYASRNDTESDTQFEEEEEEEEEEDWKKGKTKEEQVQMLIDAFQNKHLFTSDENVVPDDEDGCHEMTYQEFVKYNFEVEESGGFEVGYYPKVFSCGMIKPYYDPPKKRLKPNELSQLVSFAQKAIDKYNKKNNTNYGLVNVSKATSEGASGIMYYITYKASNDAGVRTFQAKVYEGIPRFGVPRIKVRLVRLLRMHK